MNLKQSSLIRFTLALFAAFNLLGTTQAAPQTVPELYVFPAQGAPGAMLYLSAYNIPPATYEVQIWDGISRTKTSLCNLMVIERSNGLRCTAILPDLPAGSFTILINSPDYGASTPFTILSALALSLNPTTGPPGTMVDFSVTNLQGGQPAVGLRRVPDLRPGCRSGRNVPGQIHRSPQPPLPSGRPGTGGWLRYGVEPGDRQSQCCFYLPAHPCPDRLPVFDGQPAARPDPARSDVPNQWGNNPSTRWIGHSI